MDRGGFWRRNAPPVGVALDRQHQLARGLRYLLLPGQMRQNLVTGKRGVQTNTLLDAPTILGARGLTNFSGGGGYLTFDAPPGGAQTGDITILAWVRQDTADWNVDRAYIFGQANENTGDSSYEMGTGFNDLIVRSSSGFSHSEDGVFSLTTAGLLTRVWHCLAVTITAAHVATAFADGRRLGSAGVATPAASNSNQFYLGSLNNFGAGGAYPGVIGYVGYWNRILTDAELRELYVSPFAMMEAPAWRKLFAGASVVNVTVTPAQLTVTTSVLASTVTAAQNATVTPAQLTVTASVLDPTVDTVRAVTLTPGQLTATASVLDPTVEAIRVETVTPAQLAVTASVLDPTVSAVRAVTLTPAQLTATVVVLDPTIEAIRDATVTPGQLTVAVSVLDPTVTAAQNATVTPAQLTVTASVLDPTVDTVRVETVTPAQLTATVSVLEPTVLLAGDVSVQPAQLTATASVLDPTVDTVRNATVTPSQVAATVSVLAPTIATVRAVTVQPARLTLTVGILAPTVHAGAGVSPGALATATVTLHRPADATVEAYHPADSGLRPYRQATAEVTSV